MLPIRQLWSPEAEQAVIGGVMMRNDALVDVQGTGIRADCFNDLSHREIWADIESLGELGKPQDMLTLGGRLDERGKLQDVGGYEYLADLANNTPSSANVVAYASMVVDKAHQRRYYELLVKAADGFTDPTIADPVGRADQLLALLEAGHSGGDLVPIKQVARDYVAELDDRHKNPGIRGLLTGYSNIDYRLKGLQSGQLVVIAARPSMGKTNYVLNILRNAAVNHRDKLCLGFSLEMGNSELFERMVAAQGKIQMGMLQTGKVFEHEDSVSRLYPSVSTLGGLNVSLCDSPSLTVQDICSMARRAKRKDSLGLVFVDYLGLVDCAGSEKRHDLVIGEITRSLKKLAREIECPVVLLAQLSRKVEERKDKRPLLSDLKDSGSIEADADVVQFLYRDEYYNESSMYAGQVDVITAKCRKGETGTDHLTWRGEYALMESNSIKDQGGNFDDYQY